MSSPRATSNNLRQGRGPSIWVWCTFATLFVSLMGVASDIGSALALQASGQVAAVSPWAWWLYFIAQLANKVPVAYQYPHRGAVAVLDVLGFITGLAGVACVALETSLPGSWARLVLTSATLAWLVLGVAVHMQPDPATSLSRRLYCAFFAFLVPSFPMCAAWIIAPSA